MKKTAKKSAGTDRTIMVVTEPVRVVKKSDGTAEIHTKSLKLMKLEAFLKEEKAKRAAAEKRRRAQKTASTKFEATDVVVTDPCYVFVEDADWEAFCRELGFDAPQVMSERFGNTIAASTIYGDWTCELNKHDGEKTVRDGTFTADSGTVCVTEFTKAAEKALKRAARQCYHVIRGFTGTARIVHRRGVCHVELVGTVGGKACKYWSRQIAG